MSPRLAAALVLAVPLAAAGASSAWRGPVPALACPPGTDAVSRLTPTGQEEWCRRVDGGARHGPSVAWHANGRKQAEGGFLDGREQGAWTRWWANGRPLSKGAYQAGVKQGRWRFWHSSGVLQEEGEMRDGREQGVWRRWYENGRPLSEGAYRDGVPDGAWSFWYNGGRIREASEYRGGERRGPWRRWSVNGRACHAEPDAAPSALSSSARARSPRSARRPAAVSAA